MLFPNHPAYAEIRAGMGYQPGAHALLGYTAPAHDLGDFSASMENAAVDAGISTNDIDLLNTLGATDQDLSDLINGNITLTALYAKYGVTIPGGGGVSATTPTTPASATVTTPAPPSPIPAQSSAQSPPGSTLLYTASYDAVKGFTLASTVISDIAAQLTAHGMSMLTNAVQQSGLISKASFTMTVLDSVGHQYLTDAQSVLDALLNEFTSNGKLSSSVTLVSAGTSASGQPGGNPNPPKSDFGAWLENNAVYIGLAVAGIVVVSNLTGGRRR